MISMILTEEIFQETYIVRRLKIKESVKSFDCGDTDLNDFILNESLLYRKALLAVSYVVEDKKNNNRVAAYFSLANDRISLTDFKDKTEFNHFRKHRFVNAIKKLSGSEDLSFRSRSFSEGYRHGLIPFSFYSELFCYK